MQATGFTGGFDYLIPNILSILSENGGKLFSGLLFVKGGTAHVEYIALMYGFDGALVALIEGQSVLM